MGDRSLRIVVLAECHGSRQYAEDDPIIEGFGEHSFIVSEDGAPADDGRFVENFSRRLSRLA